MTDDPILAALARLEAGQGAIVVEQTRLRVDMMGKLEAIQNALTGIRDDIGVNMGSADRAILANDHTRDEVRLLGEQMSAMWRQIKRLESDVRELRGEP
jgi:hypothetical protein